MATACRKKILLLLVLLVQNGTARELEGERDRADSLSLTLSDKPARALNLAGSDEDRHCNSTKGILSRSP